MDRSRTVAQWKTIIGNTDATNTTAEEAAASRILSDMKGYNARSKWRGDDVKELANALKAWSLLTHS